MEVLKITEQEDGSAILDFDLTEEEINILVNYAIVDILRKKFYKVEDNKNNKMECSKCGSEISSETILNFPDTELCENCIN